MVDEQTAAKMCKMTLGNGQIDQRLQFVGRRTQRNGQFGGLGRTECSLVVCLDRTLEQLLLRLAERRLELGQADIALGAHKFAFFDQVIDKAVNEIRFQVIQSAKDTCAGNGRLKRRCEVKLP